MAIHTLDEQIIEAFLDGLDLGRMERMRRASDFPRVPTPQDEYNDGWPYQDEDGTA